MDSADILALSWYPEMREKFIKIYFIVHFYRGTSMHLRADWATVQWWYGPRALNISVYHHLVLSELYQQLFECVSIDSAFDDSTLLIVFCLPLNPVSSLTRRYVEFGNSVGNWVTITTHCAATVYDSSPWLLWQETETEIETRRQKSKKNAQCREKTRPVIIIKKCRLSNMKGSIFKEKNSFLSKRPHHHHLLHRHSNYIEWKMFTSSRDISREGLWTEGWAEIVAQANSWVCMAAEENFYYIWKSDNRHVKLFFSLYTKGRICSESVASKENLKWNNKKLHLAFRFRCHWKEFCAFYSSCEISIECF